MPDTHASHQEQIARDRASGLLRAGIGRDYHGRKLGEIGAVGERLAAWVNGPGPEETRKGRGWTLVGPGAASYDATLLLARGLFVRRVTVFVLGLHRLLALLDRQGEELELAETCDALFVTDFIQSYADGVLPFTGREIVTLEAFLGWRLDNSKALFLHASRPLYGEGTWWSGNLLQRVARKNQLVQATESLAASAG